MEVDPTQPAIETPGVKVVIEPEPQTAFSPTSQSVQKGQWIVTQVVDFLSQLSENLGRFLCHRRYAASDKLARRS